MFIQSSFLYSRSVRVSLAGSRIFPVKPELHPNNVIQDWVPSPH